MFTKLYRVFVTIIGCHDYMELDFKKMLTDSNYSRISARKSALPFDAEKNAVIRKPQTNLRVERVQRPRSLQDLKPPEPRPCAVRRSRSRESTRPPMPLPRSNWSPLRIYGDASRKKSKSESDTVDASLFRPTAESGRLIARYIPAKCSLENLKSFFENNDKSGGGEIVSIARGASRKEVIIQYKYPSGKNIKEPEKKIRYQCLIKFSLMKFRGHIHKVSQANL